MFHQAALAERVQAFGDGGSVYQISATYLTSYVTVQSLQFYPSLHGTGNHHLTDRCCYLQRKRIRPRRRVSGGRTYTEKMFRKCQESGLWDSNLNLERSYTVPPIGPICRDIPSGGLANLAASSHTSTSDYDKRRGTKGVSLKIRLKTT